MRSTNQTTIYYLPANVLAWICWFTRHRKLDSSVSSSYTGNRTLVQIQGSHELGTKLCQSLSALGRLLASDPSSNQTSSSSRELTSLEVECCAVWQDDGFKPTPHRTHTVYCFLWIRLDPHVCIYKYMYNIYICISYIYIYHVHIYIYIYTYNKYIYYYGYTYVILQYF